MSESVECPGCGRINSAELTRCLCGELLFVRVECPACEGITRVERTVGRLTCSHCGAALRRPGHPQAALADSDAGERMEYCVLRARPQLVGGYEWCDGEKQLGGLETLDRILASYSRRRWEVIGTLNVGMEAQILLKRRQEPSEISPAAAPEGRGDEVAPAARDLAT
jgi:ribosomal protein S27E